MATFALSNAIETDKIDKKPNFRKWKRCREIHKKKMIIAVHDSAKWNWLGFAEQNGKCVFKCSKCLNFSQKAFSIPNESAAKLFIIFVRYEAIIERYRWAIFAVLWKYVKFNRGFYAVLSPKKQLRKWSNWNSMCTQIDGNRKRLEIEKLEMELHTPR